MPIDLNQPPDDIQIPNIPSYLRGLLRNQIDPAFVYYSHWWHVAGNLSVGVNVSWQLMIMADASRPPQIVSCVALCKTAPAGQSLIIDVNKNGSTIYTTQANRPSVGAGIVLGVRTTPDVTNLLDGDILTIDIDQVGIGTPGADLTVVMLLKQRVIFP